MQSSRTTNFNIGCKSSLKVKLLKQVGGAKVAISNARTCMCVGGCVWGGAFTIWYFFRFLGAAI